MHLLSTSFLFLLFSCLHNGCLTMFFFFFRYLLLNIAFLLI